MTLNPRITANQQRTFLAFLPQILPFVGRDSSLPRRIKELLGSNRALGSRDRRLYRELIYTTLRFLPWIEPLLAIDPDFAAQAIAWLAPDLKDTLAYRSALLADWPPVPSTLAEKAATLARKAAGIPRAESAATTNAPVSFHFSPEDLLPAWFRAHCPAAFETRHLNSILSRAPIWVRLQLNDRSLALNEFKGKGWDARPAAGLPDAFALPPNAGVADTDAHRRGFVEIQDLGSQLVLAHTPVVPGQIWLDACAGAGGKTIQLAHALISAPGQSESLTGRVDATDLRPSMLDELHERASRARLANVRIVTTAAGPYDGVLIDAPCSGSGTWRRLPHMKWYTQPAMLAEFAVLQLSLLTKNASLVKSGGLLVYATCSLSHVENLDVVAAFLAQHTDFAAEKPTKEFGGHYDGHGTTLLPGTLDSDGFYVALLRRQ